MEGGGTCLVVRVDLGVRWVFEQCGSCRVVPKQDNGIPVE